MTIGTISALKAFELLGRYAAALREVGRVTPALQAAPLGEQLAHAVGTIDQLQSSLAASAAPDAGRLHFLLFAVTDDALETIQDALTR